MTVITMTLVKPHPGKGALAENRAKQYAGIFARHGATVRVARIVAGSNDGGIAIMRAQPNFSASAKAFQSVMRDPAHADFQRERETNPAAEVIVPRQIVRLVYGDLKWDTHPVSHMRVYDISRANLPEALALLPEASSIVGKADVNVVCAIPVAGDNMSSLTVSYQFQSLDHWGEALDTIGTSEEFQALLAKAGSLGTVQSAFGMVPL